MNNDLISREALKNSFADMREGYPIFSDTEMVSTKDIAKIIDNAPTVNIPNYGGQVVPDTLQGWKYEERPQGEWIYHERENELLRYKCSQCGVYHSPTNFCPCCGASMKGGAENDK